MKNILLYLCITLLGLEIARAQSTVVAGVFPTIDHSGKITKNLEYSLYYFGAFPTINIRNADIGNRGKLFLLYSEQVLTTNLNKKLSFSGSYVYQREAANADMYLNENRIFIQGTYKQTYELLNLKHRLRFDNRFIQNKTTTEKNYKNRIRYLFGIDFPIKSKKNNLYFTAYEEAFFNTYKNAGNAYAENWAYASFGLALNNRNKIETGPLYIAWKTGEKNWFHQYYLQLTWIYNVDFSKSHPSE